MAEARERGCAETWQPICLKQPRVDHQQIINKYRNVGGKALDAVWHGLVLLRLSMKGLQNVKFLRPI